MRTIPSGYKRTEGGVIPVDWLEHTIGELIEFEGGSQPDKSVFRASWKPGYVRLIQIRDYKTDRFETYIPAKLARRFCGKEDIMIGRYGPPVFQILRGIEGAYNVALIKAKPLAAINHEYAYYFLKQDKLFGFIEKLSQRSSGQTGVDLKELRQYPLPLPPTDAEQEAIAEALSDADALIESLEQLLAKKRHLKQAAMQELLTGKKRLPGFSGAWVVMQLGDVATFHKGKGLPKSELLLDGAEPCIHYGELFTQYPEVIDEILSRTNSSKEMFTSIANDVLMPTSDVTPRGLAKASCVKTSGVILGGDILVIRAATERISGSFLSYVIRREELQVLQLVTGSTVFHLYGSDMKKFRFQAPPVREQVAIVEVLADMDAEIAELESELAKTHALKQGMMQKLLTGEIRLI